MVALNRLKLRYLDSIASPVQLSTTIVFLRATLALFGSGFLWTGAWDILTEGRVHNAQVSPTTIVTSFTIPMTHFQRTMMYLTGGWVLCVVADTLTWQAGMWSHVWHPSLWGVGTRWALPGFVARCIVGVAGVQSLWVGLNDLPAYYVFEPSQLKDILMVIIGLTGVALTGTYEHMSFAFSEATDDEEVVNYTSSRRERAVEILRSTLSVIAQGLAWLGSWDLMGLNAFDQENGDVWYLLFMLTLGILLMVWCGTYVGSSWIDTDYVESTFISNKPTCALMLRAYLSITGYIFFLNSFWVLVDMRLYANSLARNVVYFFGGSLLCYISGSLAGNILTTIELREERQTLIDRRTGSSSGVLISAAASASTWYCEADAAGIECHTHPHHHRDPSSKPLLPVAYTDGSSLFANRDRFSVNGRPSSNLPSAASSVARYPTRATRNGDFPEEDNLSPGNVSAGASPRRGSATPSEANISGDCDVFN